MISASILIELRRIDYSTSPRRLPHIPIDVARPPQIYSLSLVNYNILTKTNMMKRAVLPSSRTVTTDTEIVCILGLNEGGSTRSDIAEKVTGKITAQLIEFLKKRCAIRNLSSSMGNRSLF
jgi:hypothetical protein